MNELKQANGPLKAHEWRIGIDSWVIQDGNYVDFAVGERRRFALEFNPHDLHSGGAQVRLVTPERANRYKVNADVVVADPDLMVLDFGLLAYIDSQAPEAAVHDWLSGTIDLEVDCYSYFDIHARKQNVPAAVYTWTITGIWRQAAPLIHVSGSTWRANGGASHQASGLIRDPDQLGWVWLDRTDGWTDDDGRAAYLLRCRLESDDAVRHP